MNLSEAVADAKASNKLVWVSEALSDLPGWSTFESLFRQSSEYSPQNLTQTFGTLGIDHAELISDSISEAVDIVSDLHPGKFTSALAIIHFLNATDNEIPDEAKSFYDRFRKQSDQHIPENFETLMIPTRHSDPVDGIYVQCVGATFWTAFYEDYMEKFVLQAGDIIIIPKGIEHTVETLMPRCGVSMGFAD